MRLSTTRHRYFLLWLLFGLTAVVSILESSLLTGGPFFDTFKFSFILQFTLLACHAAWTMSWGRGLLFIFIAMGVGLIAELIGVRFGVLSGGFYTYNSSAGMVGGVPLLILLYWGFFVYTGYCISSSFLFWVKRVKPSTKNNDGYLLPFLIILDGLLLVAIDLIMDPIMVKRGYWQWLEGGTYFDVPLGNFFGWFIVVICSSGSFRLYEYFRPQPKLQMPYSSFMIPVIGYASLCLLLVAAAVKTGLNDLALVGLFFMFPVVVINLFLYCSVYLPHNRKTEPSVG